LYATAVKEDKNNEVMIKIVNTDSQEKLIEINPKNIKLGQKLTKTVLIAPALSSENNFKTENIQPVEDNSVIKKGKFLVKIPAHSLVVLKIK
jgi:alpha-N-arabinofuranosidase